MSYCFISYLVVPCCVVPHVLVCRVILMALRTGCLSSPNFRKRKKSTHKYILSILLFFPSKDPFSLAHARFFYQKTIILPEPQSS